VDDAIRRLERTLAEAPGRDVALDLARACLRAGRPARALAVARVAGEPPERLEAARALGRRLGLEEARLADGLVRFRRAGLGELVVVPGGAFLEDGPTAWTSSLTPGSSRATLRRVVLPDLVVAIEAVPAVGPSAREARALLGGARLPTATEWKKAWRGGLFLDGDLAAARPSRDPDPIGPWGAADPPGGGRGLARSPYGIRFDLAATEWIEDEGPPRGIGWHEGVRFEVSLATADDRAGRRLAARAVYDLPPDP